MPFLAKVVASKVFTAMCQQPKSCQFSAIAVIRQVSRVAAERMRHGLVGGQKYLGCLSDAGCFHSWNALPALVSTGLLQALMAACDGAAGPICSVFFRPSLPSRLVPTVHGTVVLRRSDLLNQKASPQVWREREVLLISASA